MTRLERDIICGRAERLGLRYRRVFAYAVDVERYIFFDFQQALSFVERSQLPGKRYTDLLGRATSFFWSGH